VSDSIVRKSASPPPAPVAAAARGTELTDDVVREVLAFVIADETYAVPLAAVREILKMPALTEVPRASGDVLGIISVRGRITTILDLRRRLRMPEAPPTKHTRVLLVDDGRETLGLLVDRVLSVHRLRQDEIELASSMGGDTADYVQGIGRPRASRGGRGQTAQANGEEMLILLDPHPLLRR
jgi:purine-binding chemotaxis protein CheW